jgi:hypothetical protein
METNCEHTQGPLTVLGTQGRGWGGASFRVGLSLFLLPDDGTHWTGGFPMARQAGWRLRGNEDFNGSRQSSSLIPPTLTLLEGSGFFGFCRSSNLISVTEGY